MRRTNATFHSPDALHTKHVYFAFPLQHRCVQDSTLVGNIKQFETVRGVVVVCMGVCSTSCRSRCDNRCTHYSQNLYTVVVGVHCKCCLRTRPGACSPCDAHSQRASFPGNSHQVSERDCDMSRPWEVWGCQAVTHELSQYCLPAAITAASWRGCLFTQVVLLLCVCQHRLVRAG